MPTQSDPVVDYLGRVMFHCPVCRAPITKDDLFELGLRPPEHGETTSDYQDAELIDAIEHPACIRTAKAG